MHYEVNVRDKEKIKCFENILLKGDVMFKTIKMLS